MEWFLVHQIWDTSNLGKVYWEALKWVLRYVKGSSLEGLVYSKCYDKNTIVGYVAFDYAANLDGRHWLTRYISCFMEM